MSSLGKSGNRSLGYFYFDDEPQTPLRPIVHHRLRLLAFPTRTSAARVLSLADHESSRSRTKSVHTCQVLRPRRAGRALAQACSSVLPSATLKASALEMRSLSPLNSLALEDSRLTGSWANISGIPVKDFSRQPSLASPRAQVRLDRR